MPKSSSRNNRQSFDDRVTATTIEYGPSTTGYRVNDDGEASTSSDADGSDLANHYLPLVPEDTYESFWSRPLEPFLFVFFKVCEIYPGWDGVRGEASPLVSLQGEDENGVPQFGIMLRDGTAASVNEVLTSSLVTRLSGSNAWASGAEVMLAQGKSGFHAVVFAPNGTGLTDVVGMTADGKLGTAADFGFTVPTSTGPASRSGFVPVYSRVADLAFVVGGALTSNGAQARDIWRREVRGTGGWQQVPLTGVTLETVLAATYSFRDAKLWVLDESRTVRRLLRIDPLSGKTTIVGSWARSSAFNKQWLVLDLEGDVVLASSSESAFGIARFRSAGLNPTIAPTVVNLEQGARRLMLPPAIDAKGNSIVTRTSPTVDYVTERRTTFQGSAATIAALDAIL
ncbi:MAG: hypothetical protein HOW73_23940 [Polyangiaceae bacterium]|nr:hypothetical protein [Polyangiaceae bacterium]